MERTCDVLTIADIVEINRIFIEQSGEEYIGLTNLQNPDPLKYVLEAIQGSFFMSAL
jgi:hypothetical protein